MIDIISHLKRAKYDYMELPKGDGVTDDSMVIQRRMDSGLDPFGCNRNHGFYAVSTPLKVGSNVSLRRY